LCDAGVYLSAIIKEFVNVFWFLVRGQVDEEVTLAQAVTFDKFLVFATPMNLFRASLFFGSNGECQFPCAYRDFFENNLLPGFGTINSILVGIFGTLFDDVYSFRVKKLFFLNRVNNYVC
jgi:hypothetical protein